MKTDVIARERTGAREDSGAVGSDSREAAVRSDVVIPGARRIMGGASAHVMAVPSNKRFLLTLQLYTEAFHEGVLSYCLEHGHEVTLLDAENLEEIRRGRYDGVIGGVPGAETHPISKYILESGVPVVEYSRAHSFRKNWCRIPLDAALCSRMAADYLLRRPVASFAIVASGGSSVGFRLWERHYRNFLRRGINGRPYSQLGYDAFSGDPVACERRFADYLKALPRPAGVFATTDVFAAFVCAVARRSGLRVPEDLYVIANGNRELITRLAPVPITGIDIDYAGWGRAAAAMLDDFTSGKIAPGTVRLFSPAGVIERASTGGAAGGHPLANRAVALMGMHLREPLKLPLLAERLGTSPATLKRAFAAGFGTGVAEHYLALRIRTAKGLLASGEKVESVARASGFASTSSFRKAFVKLTGVTPGSFESQHPGAA